MKEKILILILSLFPTALFSQNAIQTDWKKQNLKGKVKSYVLHGLFINGFDKSTALTRNLTPSGANFELSEVHFNKLGLTEKYKLDTFNDDLIINNENNKENTIYVFYDEIDLDNKLASVIQYKYPSQFPQNFYLPKVNFYFRFLDNPNIKSVAKNYFHVNYNNHKRVEKIDYYRKVYSNYIDQQDSINNAENLLQPWAFFYDENNRLEKIIVRRKPKQPHVDIPFVSMQFNMTVCEVHFEYDTKNRIAKYSIYNNTFGRNTIIASVTYVYNERKNYVKSEKIYKLVPDEFYLSNVHNYEKKYNEHGDLIASLLYVKSKDKDLVRNKQKYLDCYFAYTYDKNSNWISCKTYLKPKKSKPILTLYRKILYFED